MALGAKLASIFGQHAQCDVLAGLGAAVSTRYRSPYTCFRVNMTLFWPAALHYSSTAGLGDAVSASRCSQGFVFPFDLLYFEHVFVFPVPLRYFESCRPWRCRPHTPLLAARLRACERNLFCRLLSTPSSIAGLGALHVRHACHTPACVRASISSSTTSRASWLCHCAPCTPHLRVRGQLFPALSFDGLALALFGGAMLAAQACVRATISGFATSTESWPWCSACAPCSLHIHLRVGKRTF